MIKFIKVVLFSFSPSDMGVQVPADKSLICLSTRGYGKHTIMHFGPWGLVGSWQSQDFGRWHRHCKPAPQDMWLQGAILVPIYECLVYICLDHIYIFVNILYLFGLFLTPIMLAYVAEARCHM